MADRARDEHVTLNPYRDFLPDEDFTFEQLHAGEPIYAAGTERRDTFLPAALTVAVLLVGGWGLVQTKSTWEPLLPPDLSTLVNTTTHATAPTAQADQNPLPSATPYVPLAASPPVPDREIANAPGAEAGTPVEPSTTPDVATINADATEVASSETTTNSEIEPAPAPLPTPKADPADPYQTRAVAVGLHPGLSPGLLTRMSPTDYRNAAIAIRKALTETKDGEKLVWPQQQNQKLASFEVHFVRSATPECRRYVVTVTKDRWSTTAQPMEKCGSSDSTTKRSS
jgi:surface antigen